MIQVNLRKLTNLISLIGIIGIFTGSAVAQIYYPTPAPQPAPQPAPAPPPASPPPAAPPASPPPAPPSGGGMTGGGAAGGGMTGGGMTDGPTYGGPPPGGGTGGGAAGGGAVSSTPSSSGVANYHVGFDRPEAWALKYFASATLLNGLQPPEPTELRRIGAVSLGFETDWLPTLDAGQQRIGFNGTAPEDLNKSQVLIRPVIRVDLPWKLTAIAAAPVPISTFGLKPRLFAFGLERPLIERNQWTLNWRGYGQVGSVKGAFTCPHSSLAFPPGSSGNPTNCVGTSEDVATLRYAGMEFQVSHPLSWMPRLVPHASVAGNFIDGAFQSHAPATFGLAQQRMWTRGGTFSTTGGVSYMLNKQTAFTVDVFYSPLWVARNPGGPSTNDGLFNVRALLSYHF